MKKRTWISAVLGAVALASAAIAQQIFIPQLPTSHPFLDQVKIVGGGQPQAQDTYVPWAVASSTYGYYKNGAGNTPTFPALVTANGTAIVQFGNSSSMAYLYIYLPAAPYDGAQSCYFSVGGITATVFYAGTTSATLNNAITTMSANTRYCFLFSANNTTWDRDQ